MVRCEPLLPARFLYPSRLKMLRISTSGIISATWRRGQVARQGSAKASSWVQIPSSPLVKEQGETPALFVLNAILIPDDRHGFTTVRHFAIPVLKLSANLREFALIFLRS